MEQFLLAAWVSFTLISVLCSSDLRLTKNPRQLGVMRECYLAASLLAVILWHNNLEVKSRGDAVGGAIVIKCICTNFNRVKSTRK